MSKEGLVRSCYNCKHFKPLSYDWTKNKSYPHGCSIGMNILEGFPYAKGCPEYEWKEDDHND